MRYRRVKIPGGTFFFTVNLADRRSTLLTDCIASLREAVRTVKLRHPFHIHAWVVLPGHMHAIWTMPGEDDDYSMRWMLIKQRFSRAIASHERVNASKRRKGERGVWQRRFWEHQIRDDIDLGAPHGLRAYQPGEARLCRARQRLAIFVDSSIYSTRRSCAGLGV